MARSLFVAFIGSLTCTPRQFHSFYVITGYRAQQRDHIFFIIPEKYCVFFLFYSDLTFFRQLLASCLFGMSLGEDYISGCVSYRTSALWAVADKLGLLILIGPLQSANDFSL